jgi:hypothetical protein
MERGISRLDEDKMLREHLVALIKEEHAHINFPAAIRDFPFDLLGKRVPNLAHTVWHLVYHMHVSLWDILEFVRNPAHVSPDYPKGYWPETEAPRDTEEWNAAVDAIQRDINAMAGLVSDPGRDLFAPIPHGTGQTLLREAFLVADHNAYHVAQLVDIRMLLGVPVRDY